MQLVFATNNAHKIKEVTHMLGGSMTILSLKDIHCLEELPETQPTIPENAIQKAQFVYEKYGFACFSEDTGLEIDALSGAPGVHTAYYAGAQRSATDNMQLVLTQLGTTKKRTARFRTVIALIVDEKILTFEGIVEGRIALAPRGTMGFGYDPIFIPKGYRRTFAEMHDSEKNGMSHRARAVAKLVDWLLVAGDWLIGDW
jgi:XTP/dITP diphosphohydrolase